MPRGTPKVKSAIQTTNVTVTTTNETEAVQLDGISTSHNDAEVAIFGIIILTAGTGTTTVTGRVRRGTGTSGTLIGEANAVTVTAGNTVQIVFGVRDTPGEVAGESYIASVQQAGATADGTILYAALHAVVI